MDHQLGGVSTAVNSGIQARYRTVQHASVRHAVSSCNSPQPEQSPGSAPLVAVFANVPYAIARFIGLEPAYSNGDSRSANGPHGWGPRDVDDVQVGGRELRPRQGPVPRDAQRVPSTIRKWERWGGGGPIEQLRRKDVREFLDWVHEQAVRTRAPTRDARPTRPASTSAPFCSTIRVRAKTPAILIAPLQVSQ